MKHKYFAHSINTKYGKFDSKTEYNRFLCLKNMENKGIISDLKTQVRFEIIPKLIRKQIVHLKTKDKVIDKVEEMAAHYTCDFTYIDHEGKFIVEEIKSKGTKLARDYPLRRKLIKSLLHKMNEELGKEYYEFNEIVIN